MPKRIGLWCFAVSRNTNKALMKNLAATVIAGLLLPAFFKKSGRAVRISRRALLYSLGFAVFCCIGNLFTLISLKRIQASVQHPIITGGTMVISLIISALRKEKLTAKNICAVAVAFVSTVLLAL